MGGRDHAKAEPPRILTFQWDAEFHLSSALKALRFSGTWRHDINETSNSPVVLLVEDEWLVRADMASGLEEAGWAVVEASTGEGAVEQLPNGFDIDLLVTDIQLAGTLSGWDVANAAREVRPDFPVIYTSGKPRNPSRQVQDSVFLSKPCNHSQVMEAGRKLITSRRSKGR